MPSRIPTERQISAGGVAYRRTAGAIDVALICVGPKRRWQLPKGVVDEGESPEATAMREVREEAGVGTRLIGSLDVVEYWYVGTQGTGERVRFHKFVHFFLLEYQSGDVRDHDAEVVEARWIPLGDAEPMLSFASERKVMQLARSRLAGGR